MAKPVRPGQPVRPSADDTNRQIEAAEAYFRTKALGEGGGQPTSAADTNTVNAKNTSGADRRQGEILEFNGTPLTDFSQGLMWLTGATPTLANGFGVLQQAVKDGKFQDCQVSGVCLALVNVSDTAHKYAKPASGNEVLQSAANGPVRILKNPGSTGEVLCAVRLEQETSPAAPTGVPFINSSGFIVPPYAPMSPNGTLLVDGTNYVVADNPGAIFQQFWLVNGGSAIPVDGIGTGNWLFETTGPVLLGDSSLIVTYGHEFGPYPEFWGVYGYQRGFKAYGDAYSIAVSGYGTVSVADCRQRHVVELFGKSASTLSQGGSCSFEIWQRGANGKKRRSPWNNITVYDLFLNKGETVRPGIVGTATWHSDYWEGDFACDPDTTDSSQYSPGGQEQFTFSGPDTSDSTPNPIAIGVT